MIVTRWADGRGARLGCQPVSGCWGSDAVWGGSAGCGTSSNASDRDRVLTIRPVSGRGSRVVRCRWGDHGIFDYQGNCVFWSLGSAVIVAVMQVSGIVEVLVFFVSFCNTLSGVDLRLFDIFGGENLV